MNDNSDCLFEVVITCSLQLNSCTVCLGLDAMPLHLGFVA